MKNLRGVLLLLLMVVLAGTIFVGCSNTSTAATAEEEKVEDQTTDVVIVGAGGGGMSAALEANAAGKDVIIVEKMPMVGGNTIRATGGINAAGTSSQEALGIEDSIQTHYDDTMAGGYEKNDPELVKTLTENAPAAVEWLKGLGADLSDVGKLAGSTNARSHRPSGGAPVGVEIVSVLKEHVEENDIEVMLNTEATEILVEDNEEVGIKAIAGDGTEFTIRAKAVIVASGGFGANEEMITELDSDLEGFGTTNHPGATGDGIEMATDVGADTVLMEEIQTHPTVVPEKCIMITEAVRGNGAILVNKEGERFVDEMETRDVVSEAILEQEGQTAFLFFDETVRESLSAIDGYIEQGLTTEGETVEGLAEDLGINAENLQATVETYNGYVDANEDAAFARTDLPTTLEKTPYYAIEVAPAVHHTMGGIKINSNAEVISVDDEVIPGLYAAGEVTGGVHGGNRLGGNAQADIIVFGRIAGQQAAAYAN